ncbi:ABC transporter permease [Kushneria marisflavi]|uniref:Quaternary ammonium transporter n=1 Tax=Kushneria marisflavi TaxID=157779 RepID=A0A240URQ6_9GAMM|nr:ABC transporter permease [Kushneria marisflavi]ART63816.1 quaternary ammonium transporter [Kushneria marisflavi]RKD85518.1 osmoprotectant transport system permease protein [Kushneria marisflavi]
MNWEWVASNSHQITAALLQHVQLVGLSLLFGFLIAFPLALMAVRWPRLYGPSLAVTGVMFTIPSLALFILLMPFTGLSMATSLIGLTLYTLLILFRNIVQGLRGVSPSVREAARALGYTPARRLFAVELPIALPVIVAGIRIAAVTIIGMVTVTALIGQGGLGQLFITGFTLSFATPLIIGFVLSVALAVAVDLALVGILYCLTPWQRGVR